MRHTRSDRGSALLLCIIILIVIVGISGAYLSFSLINTKKTNDDVFALQALYIAESGASIMMGQLKGQTTPPTSTLQPVPVAGGEYTIDVVWFGNDNVDNDNSGLSDGNDEFEQNFYRIVI